MRIWSSAAYAAAAIIFVLVLLQNWKLRATVRDLHLMVEAQHGQPTTAARQTMRGVLAIGDQPDVDLLSADGNSVTLRQLASSGVTHVWLFDPGCGTCAEEAPAFGSALQLPSMVDKRFVAITPGSADAALAFAHKYELKIPFYTIPEFVQRRERYRYLIRVPQLFRMDECGTVTRTFEKVAGLVSES